MTAPATVRGAAALLRDGRYLRLWAAGGLVGTMRWLEILVIAVYVLEATGSAFQVALMMVLRSLPLFLFGTVAGAVADRLDRRLLLAAALAGAAVVAAALGTLALAGRIEVWHIGLGAFLSGVLWSTEFPLRRTMLGEIVGDARIGAGMSLDSATTNGTRMLGPALGGVVFEAIGLSGAYVLGAALYAAGCLLIVSLAYAPAAPAARDGNVLRTVAEGLRTVRADRAIVTVLAVTVIMNLWGFPYAAMVPVIGADTLGLSPLLIGILMSAEGTGAFVGALAIAGFARPAGFRRLYFWGSALMLAMVAGFALAAWYGLALALLFVAGLGAAGFSTMQSTLAFTLAPPEMRSRVMGVLSVCIGAGPLGMLHIGLLAGWLGAPGAVLVVALEGLAALALVRALSPEMR